MDIAATPSTYNLECPISIKWTIAEEYLTALKNRTGRYLETTRFNASNIPGLQYQLKIYPNGCSGELSGKTCLSFYMNLENKTNIKADVKFSIESAGFSNNVSYDGYDYLSGKGIEIRNTSEFFDPEKKFIVDGKFTVKCEGILSVVREKLAENGFNFDSEHIGQKLWKKNNKDFTLNVGESFIKAHKYVLAAQSPVFEAMFHHSGMKESNENQMVITDFSFNVVETAVQLCYLSETSNSLNLKDKMELLQFFDKYEMLSLKTSCEASLIRDVSPSTVCQLANCSILSNAVKLEEKCAEVLTECITSRTPVADIALLDNDFLRKVVSNVCCSVYEN